MEYRPRFNTEPVPNPSNYFDFGSVHISISDCKDLADFALGYESESELPIYSRTFVPGELGRVSHTALYIKPSPDNLPMLEAFVGHTQPIQNMSIFSTYFIQNFVRKNGITGDTIGAFQASRSALSTSITLSDTPVSVQLLKGYSNSGPASPSMRNSLRLTAHLDGQKGGKDVADLLRCWGSSLNLLAIYPLGKTRAAAHHTVAIELSRLSSNDMSLDAMLWLELYKSQSEESDVVLPAVDYAKLDISAIASEANGDQVVFSAALAATALASRRIYGRTGVMPPLTTQSLTETIRTVRTGSEY